MSPTNLNIIMIAITDKKSKIQSIVNVFETGTPRGDYAKISIFNDGPNGIKQITYGKSQTTEFGNLKRLIELYIANKGVHAAFFRPYVPQIGVKLLYNDQTFIRRLVDAGRNDPIMITTQDAFFDRVYWAPAVEFCRTNQFRLPLSGLVIYDSHIHSGSILSFLRNRFQERVPVVGGDEKKWVGEYLRVRKAWLERHSIPILRKTVYRVNDMIRTVNTGDWNLENPFNANGITVP